MVARRDSGRDTIDRFGPAHARVTKPLKGGVYDAESVWAYKVKRGDRKGGTN
jgi:hypothetical protein